MISVAHIVQTQNQMTLDFVRTIIEPLSLTAFNYFSTLLIVGIMNHKYIFRIGAKTSTLLLGLIIQRTPNNILTFLF